MILQQTSRSGVKREEREQEQDLPGFVSAGEEKISEDCNRNSVSISSCDHCEWLVSNGTSIQGREVHGT